MFCFIKILKGNQNARKLEDHDLQPPIQARLIRIYPMMPQSVIPNETLRMVSCLRLELYGCSARGKQIKTIINLSSEARWFYS